MKQQMGSLFCFWYHFNSKVFQLLGKPKISEQSISYKETPLVIQQQQQLKSKGKIIEKNKQAPYDMSENFAPLLVNKTSQGRNIIKQMKGNAKYYMFDYRP